MQATDQNNARLHQEASAHYLQGRFAEALAIWRQLLAADPQDERAQEGVRLCELLTEDSQEAPPEQSVEDDAAEPIELEVPELEIDLPADAPDPGRQSEGIDLGDDPEVLSLATEQPASPQVEQEPEPVPTSDVEFQAEADTSSAGDAAATELQKRVQDLIAEASQAHAAGDKETARSVLARVFILDETNGHALDLQERLENEVPAVDEVVPAASPVETAQPDATESDDFVGDFDLLPDEEEGEAAAVPAADPAAVATATQAPDAGPLDALDDDGLQLEAIETQAAPGVEESFDDALETSPIVDPVDEEFDALDDDDADSLEFDGESVPPSVAASAPAASKGFKLPHIDLRGKASWIVIGVIVVVFAVVGIGFYMKLQDTNIRDGEAPQLAPLETAESPPPAEAVPTEQPGEAPPATVAPPTATGSVDVLMAEGREKQAAGDYAAAIVAFHSVLEQQPSNLEAVERMEAVTAAYKEQQAVQKQWLAATSLFRDGEFRSALKMFYRLPVQTDEDRVRLDRYKENGWFNMGVRALRSTQCDLARSHLTEAEQIDPEDPDVATGLALADSCDTGSRKKGYQRAVEALSLRSLDD